MKRIVAGALLLAVTALLAGCGDDGARSGADGSPVSASASASAGATAGAVDPAAGPELSVEGVTLRVPETWREVDTIIAIPNTRDAESPDRASSLMITTPPVKVGRSMDLERLESNMTDSDFEVLDRIELGGQEFAHGRLVEDDGLVTIRIVSVVGEYQTAISFFFEDSVPPEERKDVMASVLATVELG